MLQLATTRKNVIQPRLEIGRPNDKYEKEADAVADRVMRMPSSSGKQMKSGAAVPGIQMKCAKCEEEEKLQMKPAAENILQMKPGSGGMMASEGLSSRLNHSKSSGQPLPEKVSNEMGGKIGADFSGVKVHTGGDAIQMSREIGAQAFTHGSDIYFNQGKYDPGSSEGKHLLAHELTHTVQQRSAPSGILQRSCPQGSTARANVNNNDCAHSRERNSDNFITHLYLIPSGGNQASVVARWSGGGINVWPATMLDSRTPQSLRSPDNVGLKCTRGHTNNPSSASDPTVDYMAYFTGLEREGKNIGFHNSQPVGAGHHSHGCIRVHCEPARIINENTRSYDASTTLPSTQIIYNPPSIPYSGTNVTVYMVQRGDTLSGIAADHNTTVNTLKELNGLSGDTILAGQSLLVPVEQEE